MFVRLRGLCLERHGDYSLEVSKVERLIYVGEGATFEGVASKRGVSVPGHHDDLGRRIDQTNSLEHFDAVHSAGQRDVEQNQIWARQDEALQALFARQCA